MFFLFAQFYLFLQIKAMIDYYLSISERKTMEQNLQMEMKVHTLFNTIKLPTLETDKNSFEMDENEERSDEEKIENEQVEENVTGQILSAVRKIKEIEEYTLWRINQEVFFVLFFVCFLFFCFLFFVN